MQSTTLSTLVTGALGAMVGLALIALLATTAGAYWFVSSGHALHVRIGPTEGSWEFVKVR